MSDQLHDQLAALNPVRDTELPAALRAAIIDRVTTDADARAGHTSTPPRRRRPRRLFPLGLFAGLVVTSGALGTAIAIHSGRPVPRVGVGAPISSAGKPLAGTVHLLSIRVPDPAGGLPWGLRTFRTGRKAECWQFGRVLNGQLGQLGVDGFMHDDGLFHALPVDGVNCRALDGAGHLFTFQDSLALENAVPDKTCFVGTRTPSLGCDPRDQLEISYGFLGPLARSVTVNGQRTIPIAPGDEGAFMAIRSHVDLLSRHQTFDTFTATYADGSTRPVDDILPLESVTNDPPRGTTPPGYVPPERSLPAAATLRRAVHVLAPLHMGRNVVYRVRFQVPITPRRFGVDYLATFNGGGAGARCQTEAHFAGFPAASNALPRAGRSITLSFSPAVVAGRWNKGWCPGTYRGSVILHDHAHTVGTFRFTVPR